MNCLNKIRVISKMILEVYIFKGFLGRLNQQQCILEDKSTYFCRKVDQVYYRAYKLLKLYLWYKFGLNTIKILGSVFVLLTAIATEQFQTLQSKSINFIILILIALSLDLMKIVHNILLLQRLKCFQTFLDIAEILNHCQFISSASAIQLQQQQIPYNIKSSVNRNVQNFSQKSTSKIVLMRGIKYEYHKKFGKIAFFQIISTLLYQGFAFLTIFLILNSLNNSKILFYYVITSILLWFLQYCIFYIIISSLIIMFALLIMLLVLSILCCCICCCICCEQQNHQNTELNYELLQPFLSKKFIKSIYAAEIECKICMEPLKSRDLVVQLPCNQLHIFHEKCINQWFLTKNFNCPYCRHSYEQFQEILKQYLRID